MVERSTQPGEPVRSLTVTGEVDIASAGDLETRARAELDARPEILEIDLAAVTFIDSSGLGALVRIQKDATDRDITVVLVAVPDALVRLLDITGLQGHFEMRPGSRG